MGKGRPNRSGTMLRLGEHVGRLVDVGKMCYGPPRVPHGIPVILDAAGLPERHVIYTVAMQHKRVKSDSMASPLPKAC